MKSPIYVSLSAAGVTPWIPVNYLQRPFSTAIAVLISSGAVLTYTVQHTYDEPGPEAEHIISIARAATVATVTNLNHKLSVNDAVVVYGSGSLQLDSQLDSGNRPIAWPVASVVDANTYTYTVANAGPAAGSTLTKAKNFRIFPHSTLAGLSARGEGGYTLPNQAVRLFVSAYTSGSVDMLVTQGLGS